MIGKIYRNHLFRSIRKKPAQPFLIILILTLAFLVTDIGIATSAAFTEEREAARIAKYGNADVVITTNASSESRFLFSDDVTRVLPDAAVTGSFAVPYILDNTFVSGVAVSFDSVGDLFDLSFSESLPFPERERGNVAFLSRDFAEKHGISVGDSLTLSAFGTGVVYRVTGISEHRFFGSADVLTDLSGAMKLLAGTSFPVSLIAGDFSPCGTLYVKTSGNTEDAMRALREAIPGATVSATSADVKSVMENALEAISIVLVFLTLVCAFAVVSGCTYCMAKERAEDAVLFSTAGVTAKRLAAYRYGEMALYWFFSFVIGTALSVPAGHLVFSAVDFAYVAFSPAPLPTLVSAAAILLVSELTPFFFGSRGNRAKKERKTAPLLRLLPIPIVLILCLGSLFFLPVRVRFYGCLAVLVLLFLSVALFVPPLFRKAAAFFAKRAKSVSLRLALSNASNIGALRSTARLLLLLTTVLVAAGFLVISSIHSEEIFREWFRADYTVAGGTARTGKILAECDGAERVYGLLTESGECRGQTVNLWSVSDVSAFSEYSGFTEQPHGNDAIATRAYAGKYGLHIGDAFTVRVGNKDYDLVLRETVYGGSFFFLVDAESLGIPYNAYLVTGKDGIPESEVYASLTTALASEAAAAAPVSTLVEAQAESQEVYVRFGEYLSLFLVFFSAVGVADNLADSYRSRREEFRFFSLGGMKQKQIARMKRCEIAFTVLFILFSTLVTGFLITAAAQEGMLSFGSDCLSLFLKRH